VASDSQKDASTRRFTIRTSRKKDPASLIRKTYDDWARLFSATGLDPKVHIVYGGKKDNFWMMARPVHASMFGDSRGPHARREHPRFAREQGRCPLHRDLNLVFIQSTRIPMAPSHPCPLARHTGMGFGGVTSIIQGTKASAIFRTPKILQLRNGHCSGLIFDALEQLRERNIGDPSRRRGWGRDRPGRSVGVSPTHIATMPARAPCVIWPHVARDAQKRGSDGRAPILTSRSR